MTEQADFHCCLPVVSNSLYAAFYRSPDFLANVNKDREVLLLLAYKLRHVELFNDCIILISGYWPPGNCKLQSATKITDEKLKRPAENVYSRTGVRIAHLQPQILSYPSRTDSIDRGLMQTDFRSAESEVKRLLLQYYKALKPSLRDMDLRRSISSTMHNNLKLSPHAVAGEGIYLHNPLCIELKDGDIPVSFSFLQRGHHSYPKQH